MLGSLKETLSHLAATPFTIVDASTPEATRLDALIVDPGAAPIAEQMASGPDIQYPCGDCIQRCSNCGTYCHALPQ